MPTAEAGTFSLLTMKNKVQTIFYLSIAAAILVGVLSAFFLGGNSGLFPDSGMTRTAYELDNAGDVRTVYVDGAVENPGWYSCSVGETFGQVAGKAGLLNNSVVKNSDAVILCDVSRIYVCFEENGEVKYAVNVNDGLFGDLCVYAGISESVAKKITSYIDENGKLKSKKELLYNDVLTAKEWEENHFRMYVEVEE